MVYLVECSSGTYDTYFTWIDSIWDDRDNAISRTKEIKDKREKDLKEECPIDESIPFDELTEDQLEAISEWQNRGWDAQELHDPVIIEKEMNTIK